jgi:hypothetical protein
MVERDENDPELVEYVETEDGSLVLKGSTADPSFPEITLTSEQQAAIEISIEAQHFIEQTAGGLD